MGRALLVLYMVKFYLILGNQRRHWPHLTKTMLETIFAAGNATPPADLWVLYRAGLFAPIFGALADRVLRQRRTVIAGATLMAIGHFMMAFEQLFLFALAFLF